MYGQQYLSRLAKPLAMVMPFLDNSKENFFVKFMPFSVHFLEPTIEIVLLFNKSKFPSKYKVFGGLGIIFSFSGNSLSSILIFIIKITPIVSNIFCLNFYIE